MFVLLAGIAMVGSSCAQKAKPVIEEKPIDETPPVVEEPIAGPQPGTEIQAPPPGPEVQPQPMPEEGKAPKMKHKKRPRAHRGAAEGKGRKRGGQTIYDALKSAGTFNILIGAIREAGLAKTFSGGGSYTLIAPTDKAAGVSQFRGKSAHRVQDLVRSHMIKGAYRAKELKGMGTVLTYSGAKLKVGSEGGKVTIGQARIVRESGCANGVILVADSVATSRGGGKGPSHHRTRKAAEPKTKAPANHETKRKKTSGA